MRGLLRGETFPAQLLLRGAMVGAIELLGAVYIFRRIFRHAVRTGLLARYSAEGAA
jgi:ABC-2 type transport system permease protein